MTTLEDALTLRGLVSWLETKDPGGCYSYISNRDCLVYHYLRGVGINVGVVVPPVHNDGGRRCDEVRASGETQRCGQPSRHDLRRSPEKGTRDVGLEKLFEG